ncbi:MAG: DHH family phosphoesterase [Lactobacillaceae bacterium]|jgi:c-di-AMP phosphodiesterase-like protein|nr:DHH family phosphoesterase [Lactobacillaceae bacterium]
MKNNSLRNILLNIRIYFLIIFLAAMDVIGFIYIRSYGLPIVITWIVLSLISGYLLAIVYLSTTKNIKSYAANLSGKLGVGQLAAFDHLPIAVLLLDKSDNIEWVNQQFIQLCGDEDLLGRKLENVDADLAKVVKDNIDNESSTTIKWRGKTFSMHVQQNGQAIYLLDLSDVQSYKNKYEQSQVFVGTISVDNYEEVTQDASEAQAARVRSFISSTLGNWADEFDIYLRRLQADRFIVIGMKKQFDALQKSGFKILDTMREESPKENFPLTLSIGIGFGIDDINELAVLSLRNLDLALGRGGDQVVIRVGNNPAKFIGGNSTPMEKRSRSRSRMIEKALVDLMATADNILIAGHENIDVDALGAALGIYRLAQLKQTPAQIIIDGEIGDDVQAIIEMKQDEIAKVNESRPQEDQIATPFVSLANAKKWINKTTLLILVDHSRPSRSLAQKYIDNMKDRLVVIDHHRIADEEFPQKPVLFFVEQYASSTSEMVSELLSFEDFRIEKISATESTSMLAGIELDTKNFSQNTGARTFDAASFLRANGANVRLIKQLGKVPENEVLDQANLTSHVNIQDHIAISMGENGKKYNAAVAAKTADSLMRIKGVDASFVVSNRRDGRIGINARSNGKINVQLIMEEMGGGGSLENAAVQMTADNVFDAVELLQKAIQKVVYSKGESK